MQVNKRLIWIPIALLIGLIAALLFCAFPIVQSALIVENTEYWEDGWELASVEMGEQPTAIALPTRIKGIAANQSITITKQMPSIVPQKDVLLLRTSHQWLRIFVQDKLIYEYQPSPALKIAKSMGSAWHMVELPTEYSGKEISIVLTSPYSNFSGRINSIAIGSRSAHLLELMKTFGTSALMGILLISFGIIGMIVYLAVCKLSGNHFEFFYLCIFFILVGTWMLGESRLVQFFVSNPFLIYMATLTAVFAMPIPLCLFFLRFFKPQKRNLILAVLGACTLFLLSAVILQLTGRKDYMEVIPFFHLLILAGCGIALYVLLTEAKHNTYICSFFVAVTILLLCMVADTISYYISPGSNASNYVQIGIFCFGVALMVGAGKNALELTYIKATNDALRTLATTDALTGLYNRTAYDQELTFLENETDSNALITVAMLDIDSLKQINDVYGHREGDVVIKASAKCIKAAYGSLGKAFRIGGDEFLVLMNNPSKAQLNAAQKALQQKLVQYNSAKVKAALSISVGIATCALKECSIADLILRADLQMYRTKALKKNARKEDIADG